MSARPFANALELLRAAGLRPTRQRLALARLLFDRGDRHVSAEQLHGEAVAAGMVLAGELSVRVTGMPATFGVAVIWKL